MPNENLLQQVRQLVGADAQASSGSTNTLLAPIRLPEAKQDSQQDTQIARELISLAASSSDPSATTPEDSGRTEALTTELSRVTRQLAELRDAVGRQTSSVEQNTRATAENTSAWSREAGKTVRTIVDDIAGRSILSSALSPFITGLARLFGRRSTREPEPLSLFSSPSPVQLDLALPGDGSSGYSAVQYDTDAVPRRIQPSSPPANITIQVNAMDSQSFLDHSDQIARAVRQAMLNMHPLNDLVGEL